MNLRKQLRDSIGGIIIATLLGGSLALTLTSAMGLDPSIWVVGLTCLGAALACTVMTLGVWPLVGVCVLLLGGGGAAVYFKLPPYTAVHDLIIALLTDGAFTGHADAIAAIMGVLLTATAFLYDARARRRVPGAYYAGTGGDGLLDIRRVAEHILCRPGAYRGGDAVCEFRARAHQL